MLQKLLNFFFLFCLLFFFSLAAYSFFSSPIVLSDTDLWYHLNGGRHICEKGDITDNSFFSFLDPPRERADYFWLFRVLAYKCYEWGNYYGLVVLRGVAYLLLAFVIFFYVHSGFKKREVRFYALFFCVACILCLTPRYFNVRPHIFSYLFLCLSILLLDSPSKKNLLFPVAALLWVNFHGITYPVLLLLCGAYGLEFLVKNKDKASFSKEDNILFFSIVAGAILSLLGTPHGIDLWPIPFISIQYAKEYIAELTPLSVQSLLFFQFSFFVPDLATLRNILFWAIGGIFLKNLLCKQVRISHVVLFLGSVILLSQCNRFVYEFLLLNLPLVKAALISWEKPSENTESLAKKAVFVLSGILLFILPWHNIYKPLVEKSIYPFSMQNVPGGVVAFLKHINVGGNLLHNPNYGGYLQWELYPKYKIAMDMQIPHLFGDEDLFLIKNCFQYPGVLEKFTSRYDIPFLLMEIKNGRPESLKKNEDYKIVFFDDIYVLYMNQKKYPELVKQYEIKAIDPYQISTMSIGHLNQEGLQNLLQELLRICQIYPYSCYTNQLVSMIYNKQKEYEKAQQYADLVIKVSPKNPKGYRLKGDSLILNCLPGQAIHYYEEALEYTSDTTLKNEVYLKLGTAYLETMQYEKAYNAFEKTEKIFSYQVDFQYLISFAMAAQGLGQKEKAFWLYVLADIIIPEKEKEWKQKIKEQIFLLKQ